MSGDHYLIRDQNAIYFLTNHAIELEPFRPDIMDHKLNYIHYNPVEAGIGQYPAEYLFSSARDYTDI